jgi:[ribosomal protein S5]-alanine N-acetyltransferase
MVDALTLRPWETLEPEDFLAFLTRNRNHLAPWEPRRDEAYFSAKHQAELQDRLRRERAADRHYAYAVWEGEQLVGRVALSDVLRGAFESAHLGYMTDVDSCGRGIATRAVQHLLGMAFGELRLHRVQAAVIPRNPASTRVVERCGFHRIGLSPRYLCIDGHWQDHLLFAITAEDLSAAPSSP